MFAVNYHHHRHNDNHRKKILFPPSSFDGNECLFICTQMMIWFFFFFFFDSMFVFDQIPTINHMNITTTTTTINNNKQYLFYISWSCVCVHLLGNNSILIIDSIDYMMCGNWKEKTIKVKNHSILSECVCVCVVFIC